MRCACTIKLSYTGNPKRTETYLGQRKMLLLNAEFFPQPLKPNLRGPKPSLGF
jgi:hypothetical protein